MKNNARRAIGVFAATLLPLAGMVVSAGPAAASHLGCGSVVTSSTTLANDIGPCTGDGLILRGSGITLDLGGHTVTGNNINNRTADQQIGIHFEGATGDAVRNGTVLKFDAGVAIDGGGGNTVSGITARDNIAHVLLTGGVDPKDPVATPCDFGDGITTDNSTGNRITGNRTIHNGPYSGISLVDASLNNVVSGNQASDNTVSNQLPPGVTNPPNPDGSPGDSNGPCGPFQSGAAGEGRLHQDIGIRVEGPGATGNRVTGNSSTGNQLNGISIHGYVCNLFGQPFPQVGTPNTDNVIQGNSVSNNGFAGVTELLDGIGILRQGPLGSVTCASFRNTIVGNSSTGNARDGIYVTAMSHDNTINQNAVRSNGRDGIHLDGPFTVCPPGQSGPPPTFTCKVPRVARPGAENNTLKGNAGFGNAAHDGFDANLNCDNNHWVGNAFGTVNPLCVANGGSGTLKTP